MPDAFVLEMASSNILDVMLTQPEILGSRDYSLVGDANAVFLIESRGMAAWSQSTVIREIR
jgi:hypothetical protein